MPLEAPVMRMTGELVAVVVNMVMAFILTQRRKGAKGFDVETQMGVEMQGVET